MRLILSFILACVFTLPAFAASAPDAAQVRQELEQAKSAKASPAQAELVQTLESALGFINARNESLERAKQYQQVIDDFPKLARELRQQIASLNDSQRTLRSGMTSAELDQEILQVSSQLLEEDAGRSRSRIAPARSAIRWVNCHSSRARRVAR